MEWLLIVVSLIVIWVASLCKVLHESLSGSKATFLDVGKKAALLKLNLNFDFVVQHMKIPLSPFVYIHMVWCILLETCMCVCMNL